jgi:hypothetical protein
VNPFDRNSPFSLPAGGSAGAASSGDREQPASRSGSASGPSLRASSSSRMRAAATVGSPSSGGSISSRDGNLNARSLIRVICNAGSGALEYTHAFVSAYAADHFRGAVAQRLSVGAYELLSNALNFGSVASDIVLELIETDSIVGVRVANEAIQARISMLTEHLLRLRTNAEQTFLEELRRSVTGGIPRPMLGLARVTHEVGLTLDLQVQDRLVSVTAQCRR